MRIFGFAGWSGSGKTTLIENVIPRLVWRGCKLALIKHAHHAFDIDHPGKDSYRLRHAGAAEVLITSGTRWALMHELRGASEPSMEDSLARLTPCDIVLIEGWKTASIPKLEVFRAGLGKPLLYLEDPHIVAIATDDPRALPAGTQLPTLALDDYDAIATFVDERAAPIAVRR